MKCFRMAALCFVLAMSATSAFAQDVTLSARSHLNDVLNLPMSPRASALGNSFVAIKNDANSIFSNPACLSTLPMDTDDRHHIASVSFTHHVLDINEGSAVFATPVPEGVLFAGEFAAGVQYFDGGAFDETSNRGEQLGSFGSHDVALTLAYSSTASNKIHYGLGVKFVSYSLVSGSSIANYGTSWVAADAGVYYELAPALMTFGISAMNLGTQTATVAGVREAIAPNVQIGISKKLERLPFTLNLAFHNLTRDREGRSLFYALNDFSLGGEFILGKVVRLRFGYQNQLRRELTVPVGVGLAGFSLGAGFNIKNYQIDVAYNENGPAMSPLVRFGATTSFN